MGEKQTKAGEGGFTLCSPLSHMKPCKSDYTIMLCYAESFSIYKYACYYCLRSCLLDRVGVDNVIMAGLKFVSMEVGVQSVMTFGRIRMLVLHVDSLDSQSMVRNLCVQ